MYNFLNPKLLPKVSSNSAALEKYEVDNLISDNFLVKARGFLSYTSIKPPVDIDVELICPIDISYILLSTTVGTQKTTGIEILINNNSEFVSICRAFYNEAGVVFYNSRFYHSNQGMSKHIHKNFYFVFFKSNQFRLYTNVNKIKIRILRTEKSVPCLSKVEIWGNVSKACSKITANTIHNLLHKSNSPEVTKSEIINKLNEFEIPEDFKDALTFEVMSIPMTLPSGNSVDQSTLEKCFINDATYGRQACDPFTGVQFTDTRKPVLNAGLKSRIDMFLIANSHRPETFQIQRTVGKSKNVLGQDSNSSLQSKTKKVKSSVANYSYELNQTTIYDTSEETYDKLNNSSDSQDLDQAINKVLSNSNFIQFTKDIPPNQDINKCTLCDSLQNLYQIPCKHLYCKKCLLNICIDVTCRICMFKFQKSDPVKFHQ